MNDDTLLEWAVVRLATITKNDEQPRMLFATVTCLNPGRPLPSITDAPEPFSIKKTGETVWFRMIVQSQDDAIAWYRSLGSKTNLTPVPTRNGDRTRYDGIPLYVSELEDDQPWPALGLPYQEELITRSSRFSSNPAPFIGSIPGRLHRRFGDREGFNGFLQDTNARAFIRRRLHVDIGHYQEYLGSAAFISPDPVVKQIDNFMVPATEEHGERIIYRIVPYPDQNLQGLKLTAFDKQAQLLTSFRTYSVPCDGILEIDKGTCTGEYGFVLTHDEYGILAYQPATSFIRQISLNMHASSARKLTVNVPTGNSLNSPRMEYQASSPSELVSHSTIGDAPKYRAGSRVNSEEAKRRIEADAKYFGQRWFPENSRLEAIEFIRGLLRAARSQVIIADPYLGPAQIGQYLYALHNSSVSATLLTTKKAFEISMEPEKSDPVTQFMNDLSQFEEYQKVLPEIRILPIAKLHDRFLVIDDDVWFVGNSLNSIGDKASMVVRLPNPNEVIDRLKDISAKAKSLIEYKHQRDKARARMEGK